MLGAEAKAAGEKEDPDFEVWPENWPSWEIFRALETSWVVSDSLMGAMGFRGINYGAIKTVMWAYGVKKKDRRERFDDVRVMERAAMAILNRAAS